MENIYKLEIKKEDKISSERYYITNKGIFEVRNSGRLEKLSENSLARGVSGNGNVIYLNILTGKSLEKARKRIAEAV